MKKYIIKNSDGSEQHVMPAIHDTRKDALLTILHYAAKSVEDENDDSHAEISVDYRVEEVKEDDAYERIPNFMSAVLYLQAKGLWPKRINHLGFLGRLNPKHFEALDTLNKLFTIAQAWNLMDGFVPDFSNWEQEKWFPWFRYDDDIAKFVYEVTNHTDASGSFGTRICFKTSERAAQFGKQFADLYNKVFL